MTRATFALRIIQKVLPLLFIPILVSAQEKLSLKDAIGIALKNNLSILVSQNNYQVAKNNNSIGNAGMLPTIDASGATSQSINNVNQQLITGSTVDRTGVSSTNTNGVVLLDWTLFNGLQMFYTKGRLSEEQLRGEIALKAQIETTVQQVIGSYFDIVQQQKLIEALRENISIDSERVSLAQTKLDVGTSSRLEVLQARVDMNEQISTLKKQQATLLSSKDNLNYLLSRAPGTDFVVTDTIAITYQLSSEKLRQDLNGINLAVQAAESEHRISLWSLRETQSLRFPQLDFNTGYTYTRAKSEAGLILLNKTSGYNYGLSLRWNLFDGFNISRQIRNARLDYLTTGFRLSDVKYAQATARENAIRNFQNNMDILQLETDNIQLARENVDIAFERFRSGLSTSLELREAQKSFLDAEVRFVQAQYAAKQTETELMRLNGQLVQ